MEAVADVVGRVVGDKDYRGKPRVQTVNNLPSKTVQSDAHMADIREILRKFEGTGIIDHLSQVDAKFMDVSEFTDYKDLMDHVREAEATFMQLPAEIRAKFGNDVARWLDAAHDAEKADAVANSIDSQLDEVESVAGAASGDPAGVDGSAGAEAAGSGAAG